MNMKKQVRLQDLFQRTLERLHQFRGKLTDETDRVGKDRGAPGRQGDGAHRRIEGRE